MQNIGILGSGEWSNKIAASLAPNFAIKRYSTACLRDESQTIDTSLKAVWIASRNSEQLNLAKLLLETNFEGKLVLEKPYFTNQAEFDLLLQLIKKYRDRIYLSRVWAKSRLWEEFMKVILSNGNIYQISALRVGNKRRSEFHPPLDWLPHDLYLALDLSRQLKKKIEVVNSNWDCGNDMVQGTILIGKTTEMKLEAGYQAERKNFWKVNLENSNKIKIDFVTRSIFWNERTLFKESNTEIESVPILNFLNWVLNQSKDEEQSRLIELNYDFMPGASR